MFKIIIIKILNLIQKILIKIRSIYHFTKHHALPPKISHINAFEKTCYEIFKNKEINKCYDTFSKYFYDAIFLENEKLKEYAIKKSIENEEIENKKNEEFFYLEFGVFRGASINKFSKYLKNINRKIYGFDSFQGLKEDWKGHIYYPKGSLSVNNVIPKTTKNVILISGWIQDTLPKFLEEKKPKINFIHVDVDTYETTKFILKSTKKYLTKNCVILFDDLYNFTGWSVGEYKALIEEFNEQEYKFTAFSINKGNASIKFTPG